MEGLTPLQKTCHQELEPAVPAALIIARVVHKHSLKTQLLPQQAADFRQKNEEQREGSGKVPGCGMVYMAQRVGRGCKCQQSAGVRGFVSLMGRRALSSERLEVDLPRCFLYNELLQKELLNSKVKFYLKRNWNKLLLKVWEPQQQPSVSEQK